jgi:DNA-binding CsgD family transcriptional regulator
MSMPLVLSEATDRRFLSTGLYFELMRPFGINDVMKVFLPQEGSVASVFVFDTSGHGFGQDDRELFERLVPALIQLQRNARFRSEAHSATERLRFLTPREWTVLARLAEGETNAEIASALFIGPSTVRKHVEHIYDKLEVRNRAAAAVLYSRSAAAEGRRTL